MNLDILDEQGKPIPKQDAITTRAVKWLRANWRVCVPIGISLIALLISGGSLFLSMRNSEVTRRVSKLDSYPTLRLESCFVGPSPAHWSLTNTGPVEAVQIRVDYVSHRYEPTWRNPLMSVKMHSQATTIAKIEPGETQEYPFPKNWLEINARQGRPPQNSIMEILITYRRPQDLKKYSASAYYFVDPNGKWASEKANTLQGEPYESMRIALRKLHRKSWSSRFYYGEWPGDPLHPNE